MLAARGALEQHQALAECPADDGAGGKQATLAVLFGFRRHAGDDVLDVPEVVGVVEVVGLASGGVGAHPAAAAKSCALSTSATHRAAASPASPAAWRSSGRAG